MRLEVLETCGEGQVFLREPNRVFVTVSRTNRHRHCENTHKKEEGTWWRERMNKRVICIWRPSRTVLEDLGRPNKSKCLRGKAEGAQAKVTVDKERIKKKVEMRLHAMFMYL